MSESPEIVIVGAGLSGLACGRMLSRACVPFQIIEAADAAGGRLRTDEVEGFRLNRGFHRFLPAYPEARRVLDYDALDLRSFYHGLDIFLRGRFHRVADPLHHPMDAFRAATQDGLVKWRDRWYLLLLRKEALGVKQIARWLPEMQTEEYLRESGISDQFLNEVLRPFFSGMFLETDLRTSVRMFLFLFSMLQRGGLALPAAGIQAIPDQIASKLPAGALRLNAAAKSVRPGEVILESGESIKAKAIVLATGEETAFRLRGGAEKAVRSRAETCLYFAADQVPGVDAIQCVDGDGRGPVNTACVLSRVVPGYAPKGQHLVAASVIGAPYSEDLERVVREHLTQWFGPMAQSWRHLRTYKTRAAMPEDRQLNLGSGPLPAMLESGLFQCGDYCEDATPNGALLSGRRAGEAVMKALGVVA
ncbi:MAG: FAD-dependent oxidoreductase [Verrucomicrobiales bacterium]|nr:FAD-dependent oxidoreductase [Verrucomicrobiales bacterium]MCP5556732.1 FAD-dependent oxidoreductase [Verrucomicrobiaceae bacterium]